MLDISNYSSVFVLDTQLILEGRPLPELPWHELDSTGPLLLVLVPKMLSEVDAKKRDGRLGERARAFNRLVGPCTESNKPYRLIEGPPQVDIFMCPIGRIDWDRLDDLDPGEGDDRITAEALYAHVNESERLCILSYDMRPRANAVRHGLSARKPPEGWLLAPEPGPAEKKVVQLEQRIRVLEASSPLFDVELSIVGPKPVPFYQIEPLEPEARAAFAQQILRANPPLQTEARGYDMLRSLDWDYSYSQRYAAFRDRAKAFPDHAHQTLERLFNQIVLELRVHNSGHMPADHLLIEVSSDEATIAPKAIFRSPFGPYRPQVRDDLVQRHLRSIGGSSVRPDRDEVVVPEDGDFSPKLEMTCEDFRHGRTWTRPIFALMSDDAKSAEIRVRVTAKNMRGEATARCTVACEPLAARVGDLVDIASQKFKLNWPVLDALAALGQTDLKRFLYDPGKSEAE